MKLLFMILILTFVVQGCVRMSVNGEHYGFCCGPAIHINIKEIPVKKNYHKKRCYHCDCECYGFYA